MNKDYNEVLKIERSFHDRYAETLDWNKPVNEYMSYEKGEISVVEGYFRSRIGDVGGKRILDIGSGHGNCALNLAKSGGNVSSIDISQKIIAGCKHRAKVNKLSVDFRVMDACDLVFNDEEFDLVVGFRTIHHLPNLRKFYTEAYRVLKRGGSMILVEPQKYNPFVEFGRRYIKPNDRTETEHPLVPADLRLAKEIFGNLETREFEFLTVASLFFNNVVKMPAIYNLSLKMLTPVDNILAKLSFFKPLFWQVLLSCVKK